VEGSQIVLRSRIDYESAARAANGGKKAFVNAIDLVVRNMVDSVAKRKEVGFLYGGSGIGTVNANTSATTAFVISEETWSPAIWSGMENARIDILTSTFSAFSTGGNSATVSSVDMDTRTVTLAANATLTAGDIVLFEDAVVPSGTPTYNECAGLQRIISNTGTLFNISASTYTLWKGYTKSSTGSPTMAKIMDVAAILAGRGGLMEGVEVLLSPKGWQVLNNDLAALRRFDGSYSSGKLETGTEAIRYFGPTGVVEIYPHIFVKDGHAFMGPIRKRAKRIGATDTTFKTPGRGDEIFRQVEDAAAVELRAYSNDALFLETPAKFALSPASRTRSP